MTEGEKITLALCSIILLIGLTSVGTSYIKHVFKMREIEREAQLERDLIERRAEYLIKEYKIRRH